MESAVSLLILFFLYLTYLFYSSVSYLSSLFTCFLLISSIHLFLTYLLHSSISYVSSHFLLIFIYLIFLTCIQLMHRYKYIIFSPLSLFYLLSSLSLFPFRNYCRVLWLFIKKDPFAIAVYETTLIRVLVLCLSRGDTR